MKRKEFIQNSSLLIAGSLIAREKLFEIVDGEIVYGQNEKRYKQVKDWVKADAATLPVNDCHEMVQDAKGRIVLLTNETKNNVIFFNKKGKLLKTWGHDFPGAHGLTLWGDKEQILFITDTVKNQFYKTTIDGKILQTWDYPVETGKYPEAKRFVPTETTITKDGEIYLADGYGMQYIMHYDERENSKMFLEGEARKKKIWTMHMASRSIIAQAPETLIITDRTRCCFKRFSMAGEYIETISLPGACVCRPVIKGNYLYAAVLRSPNLDTVDSGFVIILNKENKVVSVLCGSEAAYENDKLKPFHQTDKLFKHPHDVLVDDEENLYVCQWSSGKVYPYKFKPVK